MSDNEDPAAMAPEEQQAFLELADKFLGVANALAAETPVARVSAAMMFATARFNAFLAQTQGLEPGDVDEETIAYFRAEYEKMLRENLAQVLSSRRATGG